MASTLHKKSTLKSVSAKWPTRYAAFLNKSVSSLTPRIEESGFDRYLDTLKRELTEKGIIQIKLDFYFGDEWFCPDKTTAIAIPFWLTNKTLKSIERNLIGFVEGDTEEEFLRLLRHEAGHCVEHAYRLSKRKDWREIFGNPNIDYDPDAVKTIPGHPDFVENLSSGYAQTHPEEDFAETFAVWLDARSNCWERYKNRPVALKKLIFVDQLMAEIGAKKYRPVTNQKIYNARRMRGTLKSYYQRRLSESVKNTH